MQAKNKKVEKKSAKKPAKLPRLFRPAWGVVKKSDQTAFLQDLARQIIVEIAVQGYNADKDAGKACITYPKRQEAEECAKRYIYQAAQEMLDGLACDGHEISEEYFRKVLLKK